MAKNPQATPTVIRRGLPRHPGGEPWPPAQRALTAPADETTMSDGVAIATPTTMRGAASEAPAGPPAPSAKVEVSLRRGLPRTPGGQAWPPVAAALVAKPRPLARASSLATPTPASLPPPASPSPGPGRRDETGAVTHVRTAAHPPKRIAAHPPARRYGPYTMPEWLGASVLIVFGLAFVAMIVIVAAMWLTRLEPVRDFLVTYPGTYDLPPAAEPGFPAWLSWQHFFNIFLIAILIRAGLGIRLRRRPSVFWASRRSGMKVGIVQWLHQATGVLWAVNGIVFIILLFVTPQWMRIVPTSWEVFPNALSAALRYLSLDWPLENGWVNYNSLQQLTYFFTVFVAAPLAVITGLRLSTSWPWGSARLNRIFPAAPARVLHFPLMLYFVVFIVGHVVLVFSTGAIRNLNAMFAGRDDAQSPVGFLLLFLGLVVTAAAVVAVRPTLLGPLAKPFGTVSSR